MTSKAAGSKPKRERGLTQQFLDYAKPDTTGRTRVISIDELNAHYDTDKFSCTNGCSWGRSDAKALIPFKVKRFVGPVTGANGKTTNRVVAIQLQGLNDSTASRSIRSDIKREITARKCVVLASSSNLHVDHKCPRQELTPHVNVLETQTVDDFQALCGAANEAKRGHCQRCVDSKQRFDARVLGYAVAQWSGGPRFTARGQGCEGCYWHDPKRFNEVVSAQYVAPTPPAGRSTAGRNL